MKPCRFTDNHDYPMKNATEAAGRLFLSLNGLATDLDTEHGETDANKRDGARQVGRLTSLACSYETERTG